MESLSVSFRSLPAACNTGQLVTTNTTFANGIRKQLRDACLRHTGQPFGQHWNTSLMSSNVIAFHHAHNIAAQR
jgi:hypothetical protein